MNDYFSISNTALLQTILQNQSPNIAKQQQQKEKFSLKLKSSFLLKVLNLDKPFTKFVIFTIVI